MFFIVGGSGSQNPAIEETERAFSRCVLPAATDRVPSLGKVVKIHASLIRTAVITGALSTFLVLSDLLLTLGHADRGELFECGNGDYEWTRLLEGKKVLDIALPRGCYVATIAADP